jgi:D-alanyl-D-alanine carboxypeptidase (penicillin-binding protein 5/6)
LRALNTAALLVLFFFSAAAQALPVPAPPTMDATSYFLQDAQSGRVLAAKNPDKHVAPASITKLMVVYVVFHALRTGTIHMNQKVTVSDKAWRMHGSQMFLEVGHHVSIRKLLKGLIVDSGNDAAVQLAEAVGGSESSFVDLMNQYAHKLGMKNTHYMDAAGLPHPNHYTSARDIATLDRAIIQQFPKYYKMFGDKEFTYDKIHQTNRNLLLWRDPSVDGLKTGHTQQAGYCLTTSAKRHGMRLIAVVMGTPSDQARNSDNEALLNYGFNFYETHRLYAGGATLAKARVWKGAQKTVPEGIQSDLYVTIPKGQYDKVSTSTKLAKQIVAPVKLGKRLGTVSIALDGKPIAKRPLDALAQVRQGGLWRRLVDSVLLMF